jgi:hypothetical protein
VTRKFGVFVRFFVRRFIEEGIGGLQAFPMESMGAETPDR